MKQQSAVEWFWYQIDSIIIEDLRMKGEFIKSVAMEMEKTQMKQAVLKQKTSSPALGRIFEKQFEEYYNKTFKDKENE